MRLFAIALVLCMVGCTSTREPVAIVLGDRIYRDELEPDDGGKSLSQLVHARIMRKYMGEHHLAFSDRDLRAYLKRGDEPLPDDLLDKEGKAFFRSIIESRLFAKSLFEKYGGRVTISSFGFAGALEAQETYLREQMNKGAFTILDPALERAFWGTVTNEWGDATLSEEKAREMFSRPDFPMDPK